MRIGRRGLAGGAALAAAVVALPGGAAAGESSAPNVVVYCDRALREPMTALGRLFTARSAARVNVFCAPPSLMLAQIQRVTQNDILVTQAPAMADAVRRHLIKPDTQVALPANRLALATRTGIGREALSDAPGLLRLIGAGPLAAPDPTSGTTVDTAGALAAAGLQPPYPFHLIGAIDTEQVAGMIRNGGAKIGLIYRSQVYPGSGLSVAAVLPGQRPVSYAAAISVVTRSPNATSFMTFLRSPGVVAHLTAAGLEMPA